MRDRSDDPLRYEGTLHHGAASLSRTLLTRDQFPTDLCAMSTEGF